MNKSSIIVATTIQAPIQRVWELWTKPEHIVKWNFASHDWCCPAAVNDLRPNREFNWRMEAKDGSMGFDFTGTYEHIIPHESISYKLADGRRVMIQFSTLNQGVSVTETFETEGTHTDEQQRAGWQAILENFKQYVESKP